MLEVSMKPASHQSPIYQKYHVRPIINAAGSVTKFGGSRTRKEALEAMDQASKTLVDLADLNEKAGEVIARITGSEAGFVCNGAASGLILQAAAVIAGDDPMKMSRLPETSGLKNQIIIQTMHRFPYDQSYRVAGAELVTIGTARRTAEWELEGAINERTAAVAFLFSPFTARTGLTLPQVSEIAHSKNIPVIVDAASMVPPRENLTKYLKMGADLVSISGGKGIRGPQGSGLLFGRRDLVNAASANASPNQFLGRGMKVSKEQIIGFLTALEIFVQEDEESEMNEYRRKAQRITDALIEIPGMTVSVEHDEHDFIIPSTLITFDRSWSGRTKEEILASLACGDPPIQLQSIFLPEDRIAVDPFNVDNEELEVLIRRLREELLNNYA
jgi:L-seryl-tRNA(Ser) seleniumtransferase